MTKEQVIELAKQAGFHFWDAGFADKGILHTTGDNFSQKCFERFATLVRNAAMEEAFGAVSSLAVPPDEDNFEAGCMYAMHAIELLKEPTP